MPAANNTIARRQNILPSIGGLIEHSPAILSSFLSINFLGGYLIKDGFNTMVFFWRNIFIIILCKEMIHHYNGNIF